MDYNTQRVRERESDPIYIYAHTIVRLSEVPCPGTCFMSISTWILELLVLYMHYPSIVSSIYPLP